MGVTFAKVPLLQDRDHIVVTSYGLEEKHIAELWRLFTSIDVHCSGVWTESEYYTLIQEPRGTMRAPIIDKLFFMGDAGGVGSMCFQDFLVSATSFCALSREEIIQLLFLIIDFDRNGKIDKQEMIHWFSYVPQGSDAKVAPIFPVNNKNALDKYKGGNWESIDFNGFAVLVESFPYIPYPVYHVQESFRMKLLGVGFWDRFERRRMVLHGLKRKAKATKLPRSGEVAFVSVPCRVGMQEYLEFSLRRTKAPDGKRTVNFVQPQSKATQVRDEEIMMTPLNNIVRNPNCLYYVNSSKIVPKDLIVDEAPQVRGVINGFEVDVDSEEEDEYDFDDLDEDEEEEVEDRETEEDAPNNVAIPLPAVKDQRQSSRSMALKDQSTLPIQGSKQSMAIKNQ